MIFTLSLNYYLLLETCIVLQSSVLNINILNLYLTRSINFTHVLNRSTIKLHHRLVINNLELQQYQAISYLTYLHLL